MEERNRELEMDNELIQTKVCDHLATCKAVVQRRDEDGVSLLPETIMTNSLHTFLHTTS